MPRIRSLHPGQWTDEHFVCCTYPARLLALALRTMADDQGVFEWKPAQIKMQALPADALEVVPLLDELEHHHQVCRFEVAGRAYGAIRNFRKWQRPEKPKNVHPLPGNLRAYVGLAAGGGGPETGARSSSENHEAAVVDQSPISRRTDDEGSVTDRRQVVDASSICSAEEGGRRKEEKEPPALSLVGGLDAPPVAAESDGFAEFWQVYPRKVAKPDALKAYAKVLRDGARPADVLAGLRSFQFPDDRKFIPHPATWLNKHRWQDETPPDDTPPRQPGQSYAGCL